MIEKYDKVTSAIISDNDHVEYKQLIDRNDEIAKDAKGFADKLGKINPEMFYEMISISRLDIALEKTIKEWINLESIDLKNKWIKETTSKRSSQAM